MPVSNLLVLPNPRGGHFDPSGTHSKQKIGQISEFVCPEKRNKKVHGQTSLQNEGYNLFPNQTLESGQARGRGIRAADFLWRFFYPSILRKNGLIPHL